MIFAAILFLFFNNGGSVAKASTEITKSYDNEFLHAVTFLKDDNYTDGIKVLEHLIGKVQDEYIVMKLAEAYITVNEVEKAKKLLIESIANKAYNKSDKLRFLYSRLLYDHYKDTKNALKFAKDAATLHPKEEYHQFIVFLYENSGDTANAIGYMDKIIAVEPKSDNYYKRGSLYYKLQLNKKAIDDFEKSVQMDNNLKSLLMLSEIYSKDNNNEKAIKYLEKVISLHAGLVIPEFRLGELYRTIGNYDKSISLFESLLPKLKGNEEDYVLRQLAAMYLEKKEYTKSAKYFEQVNKKFPQDTQPLYYLGIISELQDNYTKAESYYKETLKIRKDYYLVQKRLAYTLLHQKKYDESINLLKNVDNSSKDVDYYRLKSNVYSAKGDNKSVEKTLLDGLNKNPKSEDIMFDLSSHYEKMKDYDKSVSYLKKIIAVNPKNSSALNFLGYLYADQGKHLNESYEMIKKALEIEPENSAYLDSLAWVLYKLGKYDEALKYQKQALTKSPSEQEMIEHMKHILKALKINKTVDEVLKEK